LVALAALGVLGAFTSWRLTWAGISLAAALATLLNVRTVPRPEAPERDADTSRRSLWRRAVVAPLGYAVLFFAAITVYFTYATDAARSGGLASSAVPVLFGLVGVGGLVALSTGRVTRAVGSPVVGGASVCAVAGALILLGLGRSSLTLVLASALLFGVGFMVGSSVLAVWTAEVVPDRPGEGFTSTLVVGAITSIATPAVMGALIPVLGLPTMLVLVAALAAGGAAIVPVLPRLADAAEGRARRS
jgi:predicted MFS family arabinose efflux permease